MGVNRCNAHQGADGLNRGVKVDHALVNAHLVAVEGVGTLRKHTSAKQLNTRLAVSRAKVEKEKNRRLFDTRHGQQSVIDTCNACQENTQATHVSARRLPDSQL